MRILSNQKGMTIAELLVASTFGLFLTAGTMSFTSFFNSAQYEYRTSIELTNNARLILEKMVWGHKIAGIVNRRGIAEAASGTINSATNFSYTDQSGTVHTIRQTGHTIEYQNLASGTGWISLLDANGTTVVDDATKSTISLSFTQPANPNSVTVRVVVGKNISGTWYYGSASTQVFYRNA